MRPTDGFEKEEQEGRVPSGKDKEKCARCSGRGYVLCPQCKGTGEKRNASWVVIGMCTNCEPPLKGFVLCPKCRGLGEVPKKEMPPY